MKKVKLLLFLFVATFIIGGTNLVSAYTTAPSISGLKADFLGDPHYTSSYTKTTYSSQQVQVNSVANDRTIQLAEFTASGNGVSGYTWTTATTGSTINWTSSGYQIPTSVSGSKYKIGAKLPYPWTQAQVTSGTWVLDY